MMRQMERSWLRPNIVYGSAESFGLYSTQINAQRLPRRSGLIMSVQEPPAKRVALLPGNLLPERGENVVKSGFRLDVCKKKLDKRFVAYLTMGLPWIVLLALTFWAFLSHSDLSEASSGSLS